MELSDVKHTIKLSSDESFGCAFCSQSLGTSIDWDINHLIQIHGGKLLHVGSESLSSAGEAPYLATVALIGFSEVPPPKAATARFTTQLPPAS
ncbi:hypothetical protein [Pseudomonas sp. USHLN015]|uniref:hypothetical protein n=1 Tax=Pseudomonas sp. USHLN015 TaxID=3081296 RepID=UPI00301E1231